MMREIANPTMPHEGSGWSALVGVSSAILAERGFTGGPIVTIETEKVARHWQDLDSLRQIEHQYIRPYPICRWAHAAIEATRKLVSENRLAPEDIASVHVNFFREGACLFLGVPDETSKALYSLPFAVATMIVHGRIGIEHITGSGLSNPQVAKVVERITVAEAARHCRRIRKANSADVSMTLVDGRVLNSGTVKTRGGSDAPMDPDEVIEKFLDFAMPSLGASRAEAIRDKVLGLTESGSKFSDIGTLVYDQPCFPVHCGNVVKIRR